MIKHLSITLKIFFLVLFIMISVATYAFLTGERKVEPKQVRIEEIKADLMSLIPNEYDFIESEYKEPNKENNGCIFLFQIYPQKYSEIEKQYLNNAALIYCEDIKTAILEDQIEEVAYNQTDQKWIYGKEGKTLEEKQYGDNLVAITKLGGSHALFKYYIVKMNDKGELIILSTPISNRIRCDTLEKKLEKDNCENFMTTMGMPNDSGDWVPERVYEEYYNPILKMLEKI